MATCTCASSLCIKRLATTDSLDKIETMLEEIVDRFGKLPPQAQALFDTHKLRVMAAGRGVIKIDAAPGVINVTFRPNPPGWSPCASLSWFRRTSTSS